MSAPLAGRFVPIRDAAARRPHGTHARYVAGCHCLKCRAGHSRYNSERYRAKADGDWNGIVPADKSRAHLQWLSRRGVGYKSVAAATDICPSILFGIRRGTRERLRARAERKILAVTPDAISDAALIDAGPTWTLINRMLADGYSKAQIARWMGYKVPALQIRKDRITTRTAVRVERVYRLAQEGRLSR